MIALVLGILSEIISCMMAMDWTASIVINHCRQQVIVLLFMLLLLLLLSRLVLALSQFPLV